MTTTNSTNGKFTEVPLRFELGGRLRNIGKLNHWYMAIAEAVKNAMDAAEDAKRQGWIEIELERGNDLASNGGAVAPVKNVIIRDNGIGFTEKEFNSFCTPDSLHKHHRFGKGVGRLMYLHAFQRVEAVSTYFENEVWHRREFIFQCETPPLTQDKIVTEPAEPLTTIRLVGLREEFTSSASIEFDHLLGWLTEHFLPALVEKPSWLKSLVLKDGEKKSDLMLLIEGGALWTKPFNLKNYDFRADCYALKKPDKQDMVRLVAGGRVVDANTRNLEYYFPHLAKISDKNAHVMLIRSPFFDEHVNDARNGVAFCADDEEKALLGITFAQFRVGLAEALKQNLSQSLNSSDEKLKKKVEEVVAKEAKAYKHLLNGYFDSKEFSALSTSARDEDILSSLDSYRRREAISLRKESRRLAKLASQSEDYEKSARILASKVEVQKKVALAEYISLRKIVLERFEQILEPKEDGYAHAEKEIHNLIFPQRTDSESNPTIDHQLWILDERLESYNYLSSDKPLDAKVGDRPDIMIALDTPSAFTNDSTEKARGYDRIVLVEFKQALKNLATAPTDELPHRQMMRYAHQILEGKAVQSKSQRPIKTASDVRFYLYAICELPKDMLAKLKRDEGFTLSPTGDGAFGVANEGKYYMEYISLTKLLEDAKDRNSAFFRKLGLEP